MKLKVLTGIVVALLLTLSLLPSMITTVSAAAIVKKDIAYRQPRIAQTGLVNASQYGFWEYYIWLNPCPPIHLSSKRAVQVESQLKKDFPGWTFQRANKDAPGEFQIIHYDAEKTGDPPFFTVDYVSNDPNFPPAGQVLNWVQSIGTTWPLGTSATTWTNYLDHQRGYANIPFYWNDTWRNAYSKGGPLSGGADIRFVDQPKRRLTRPALNWLGRLYLTTWDGNPNGTVTIYDGVMWGFIYRRTEDIGLGPDTWGGVGALDNSLPPYNGYEDPPPDPTQLPGLDPVNVINITATPTEVAEGQQVQVNVTVENQGGSLETCNVTAYADMNISRFGDEITIGKQLLQNLAPNASSTLTFMWDTSGIPTDDYFVSAEATNDYWINSTEVDNICSSPISVSPAVGGISTPVNKLSLLAPYIALASAILVATAATAIYVKRAKRRKEKQ